MDTVFIEGLRASTVIGVYDHERNIRQELVLDLSMDCDIRTAGRSDEVSDALDYDAVSTRSIEIIENSQFFLIEALAESLASTLLEEFPITTLRLTLSKPGAVARANNVGLRITRP